MRCRNLFCLPIWPCSSRTHTGWRAHVKYWALGWEGGKIWSRHYLGLTARDFLMMCLEMEELWESFIGRAEVWWVEAESREGRVRQTDFNPQDTVAPEFSNVEIKTMWARHSGTRSVTMIIPSADISTTLGLRNWRNCSQMIAYHQECKNSFSKTNEIFWASKNWMKPLATRAPPAKVNTSVLTTRELEESWSTVRKTEGRLE